MALALYRKYRPGKFADVAEQEHVVRTIVNELARGNVAHAYLFSGPRGVGKTTIARLLAKALNCERRSEGEGEPCGECGSCVEVQTGRFLDLVEVDAASQTKVEETRENIIENVRFAPTRGKRKVFIIDEAHMLSLSSFNALLKTLEEPPEHAVFILATTELHKIPATIVSRCQRFDFRRIPTPALMERLGRLAVAEGVVVDEDVLAAIARLAEGSLRDGETLLGQVLSVGGERITVKEAELVLPMAPLTLVLDMLACALTRDLAGAMAKVRELVDAGGSVKHAHDAALEMARAMLLLSLGDAIDARLDSATAARAQAITAASSPAALVRLLDILLVARSRTAPGAFPQLPLEVALAEAVLGAAPASAPAPVPAGAVTPAPRVAPTAPTASSLPFSLEELQQKWGRCCAAVGERNVALPLVLNATRPTGIEGTVLRLACAYQFHIVALQDPKNAKFLADAIEEILMARPSGFVFDLATPAASTGVDDIAAAFGGTVLGA